MNDLLKRVNEKISYTHSLITGCQLQYRFAINEVCPASWEDRWVDISAMMDVRKRYGAELRKYRRRLVRYQQLTCKVLEV